MAIYVLKMCHNESKFYVASYTYIQSYIPLYTPYQKLFCLFPKFQPLGDQPQNYYKRDMLIIYFYSYSYKKYEVRTSVL